MFDNVFGAIFVRLLELDAFMPLKIEKTDSYVFSVFLWTRVQAL